MKVSAIKNLIKRECQEYGVLLRSIPPILTSLFVLTVVAMNLLANKELYSNDYMALDCGFALSWFAFLAMDMMCRRYGPMAALKVSLFSIFVNLIICLFFYLISLAPGHWGQYYSENEMQIVDDVLNRTIGGTWYVVLGSAFSMMVSSAVNSLVNYLVSRCVKSRGFRNFAIRSYVSTAFAQFVDNLIFAIIVSHVFFGWSWVQVVVCACTAALFELLCEIVFSPLGYKMCLMWERKGIGKDYLDYINEKNNRYSV